MALQQVAHQDGAVSQESDDSEAAVLATTDHQALCDDQSGDWPGVSQDL